MKTFSGRRLPGFRLAMLRDTSQAMAAPSLQRRGRRCALRQTPSCSFRSGTPAPTHSFARYPRPRPRGHVENTSQANGWRSGGRALGQPRALLQKPHVRPRGAPLLPELSLPNPRDRSMYCKTRRFVCGALTRKAVNHDGAAHTCHTSKGTHEAAAT